MATRGQKALQAVVALLHILPSVLPLSHSVQQITAAEFWCPCGGRGAPAIGGRSCSSPPATPLQPWAWHTHSIPNEELRKAHPMLLSTGPARLPSMPIHGCWASAQPCTDVVCHFKAQAWFRWPYQGRPGIQNEVHTPRLLFLGPMVNSAQNGPK